MSDTLWLVTSIPSGFSDDFDTEEEANAVARDKSKGDEKHIYMINGVVQIEDWEDSGYREFWYDGAKYEPIPYTP